MNTTIEGEDEGRPAERNDICYGTSIMTTHEAAGNIRTEEMNTGIEGEGEGRT